ncbi:MAG: YIP1 family protein [Cyclobacteriaceae bacterium]|nr:YIP1 family protein [Cyclobacteriaceae bacterium]
MNLVERAKNMIVTPKTEWDVVSSEESDLMTLLKTYVLPLAVLGAIAAFIGQGLIGTSVLGVKVGGTISYGIAQALIHLLSVSIAFVLTSYVVDMLAPTFQSEKNLNKSAQLVAYSNTPAMVGALLAILPSLAWLGSLFGLYGFYLLYIGLPVLKKTPENQRIGYIIVTILVLIAIYVVLGLVLASLFLPMMGISAYGFGA